MAEFTDDLEKKILDYVFAEQAYAQVTTHFLCLLTAVTNDANDLKSQLTEPSTGGYAAKAIAFDAATGTSPTTSDNTSAITFTNTGATAWTVTGIAITDGSTASSNVMCYDNDMTDATVNQNEKIQFAAGDIDITLD